MAKVRTTKGSGGLTEMPIGRPEFVPPPIGRIEDSGLSGLWLQDLALKTLYYQGYLTGYKISDLLALPFTGVVDQILDFLKREKLVEIKTAINTGLGEGTYVYGITGAGANRAHEALERSEYAGPAPVPLEEYNESVLAQARSRLTVQSGDLKRVLSHLVISNEMYSRIGPAVNSGQSIFLFGPPGNGKTSIARAIGNLSQSDSIYIPYAIYIDGQVVKLFDEVNHQPISGEPLPGVSQGPQTGTGGLRNAPKRDLRWVRIARPFIMVGGELTLAGLDLVFDELSKFYQAPFQVKANNGILLIDDFGRQQVRPRDLLNRWIVPLENRIDYLTLHTGRKVEIPFDVLVIFSTNLPPRDLVDEAFVRRLRHKIEVGDPNYEEYRQIFQNTAREKGVIYREAGLAYLLQEWYIRRGRKMRASHPRDLCDQINDISRYLNITPEMTTDLIDRSASAYFVDLS